jgi:hypothetical protein
MPGVHYRIAEATSGPRVLALTLMVNPRYARQITSLRNNSAWRRDEIEARQQIGVPPTVREVRF